MDPITLAVTALAAGASSGAIDALEDNAGDRARAAHGKLHDLVRQRFQGNAKAEDILAEHQADPDTYALPLAKKLTEAGAGDDADLAAMAAEVMLLVEPEQAQAGRFNVTIYGGQNIIVGDHGVQVILRDRDHREDAAAFRNLSPHQIVDVVRGMSPADGELMLAEAEAGDAQLVLGPLLELDEALAISLMGGIKRDKAAELTKAATARATGMEWLQQLPEAAEMIAQRGEELRWTGAGRLERVGDYSRAPTSRTRVRRKTTPPAPVFRRTYKNGYVYWCRESETSRAWTVRGVILHHYRETGECRGRFGIPVSDETPVMFAGGDRSVQRFSSGAIYRHGSSVIDVAREVADYLDQAHDGGVHRFYPLGQEVDGPKSPYAPEGLRGRKQRFQRPENAGGEETVYYLSRAKAHGVSREIASYYELRREAEGAEGWLGYPTSDAVYTGTRVTQDFEGGAVFVGKPETRAIAVSLSSMKLIRKNGLLERLGFPVSAEEQVGQDGNTLQFFENGVVTFANKKGEIWLRPD